MSFQSAYEAVEDLVEAPSSRPDAVFHPDASRAFREAVIRSDGTRARAVLQRFGRAALDVPRLGEILSMMASQGLLVEVLRAGLRASDISSAQQQLWGQAAVRANAPKDAAALLAAGFVLAPETRREISEKALRSQEWYNVAKRL
jgi:hypothetical protein